MKPNSAIILFCLLVVPANAATMRLTWTPNTTDSDFSHFTVYRSTDTLHFQRANLVDLTSPTFIDKNLPLATTYTYAVTAVDLTGNESPKSDTITRKTPSAEFVGPRRDRTPPVTPSGVSIQTEKTRKKRARSRKPRVIKIIIEMK